MGNVGNVPMVVTMKSELVAVVANNCKDGQLQRGWNIHQGSIKTCVYIILNSQSLNGSRKCVLL